VSDGGGDGCGRSRFSITPARVELVGEGRHPVVRKDCLQRLPNDKCWIVDIGHRHEHVGPIDGETLPRYVHQAVTSIDGSDLHDRFSLPWPSALNAWIGDIRITRDRAADVSGGAFVPERACDSAYAAGRFCTLRCPPCIRRIGVLAGMELSPASATPGYCKDSSGGTHAVLGELERLLS
jgi:hypothetical protein